MNTTATYSSEHSWSRRCSTETVFSIQGQETDFVKDTTDTEAATDDDLEYEPVSEPEDEPPVDDDTDLSDTDIISTEVIEVVVRDEPELLADSEATSGAADSDSELDYHDYWHCAQCRATNNNPLYRYCEKCFTVRKHLFPPRPKRKARRQKQTTSVPRTLSQDSGVECPGTSQEPEPPRPRKRRSGSLDGPAKRARLSPTPLSKTTSEPSITEERCVMCIAAPKSGVFVHGRSAHICCCYKCALKVWARAKRCPVCNCRVSNVLKAFVM